MWAGTQKFGTYHIYVQKSPLNSLADESRRASSKFGVILPLLPYFVYARSKASGETEPMLLPDVIGKRILSAGPYDKLEY